ncbi:WXG100 family type VII secretion target [Brachybacterium phenoliresistens]|uniref:WXG100 family type VII secretion target n=1 Tax=Brachybacterium phenoliresistens TaxID=396014 RepID=Z9JQL3_9MICO|nr:hypothetical protein [Brachybacterium phenoliresistens]EWS80479.1 hypothetical protein BF93_03300 [Brachybacterium phenoliresistens]
MTTFYGADTESLRDGSSLVARRAEMLHDLEARLRALIEGVTWTGPDADAFRTEWSFRVRPAIADAAHLLRRRSLALAAAADEQDAASSPDGPRDAGGPRHVPALPGLPLGPVELPRVELPPIIGGPHLVAPEPPLLRVDPPLVGGPQPIVPGTPLGPIRPPRFFTCPVPVQPGWRIGEDLGTFHALPAPVTLPPGVLVSESIGHE